MNRYSSLCTAALLTLLLGGCTPQTTLIVTNPSLDERYADMAEVSAGALRLTADNADRYALYDETGCKVPFQVMYYGGEEPQSVIFQVADIRGGMQQRYVWRKGRPAHVTPRVSARYVPERKDDFAWENDRAAYRMYGPALADENPSNGVDLWLKCTDELVVDSFYYRDLRLQLPYHINWGKGLDCYKVAHTLGCGGIAPYADAQLRVGNHYTGWEVIDQGPLRVVFRLTYPDHSLTVTADAGAQLNKADVVWFDDAAIAPDGEKTLPDTFRLAAGIFLHETTDNISYAENGTWIAYAEEAVSDAGIRQGRSYAAVVMPDAQEVLIQDRHLLSLAPYKAGDTLTYYFGGGWSQWHDPADADWFSATAATARHIRQPLQVTTADN